MSAREGGERKAIAGKLREIAGNCGKLKKKLRKTADLDPPRLPHPSFPSVQVGAGGGGGRRPDPPGQKMGCAKEGVRGAISAQASPIGAGLHAASGGVVGPSLRLHAGVRAALPTLPLRQDRGEGRLGDGRREGKGAHGGGGGVPGMHWKRPPPPSRAPSLCPPTVSLTPSASFNGLPTDANRPQPLRRPPPAACATASGAASEVPSLLVHP